jgi:tripartite-type tricarboxylate transporter receptor subunit TctC
MQTTRQSQFAVAIVIGVASATKPASAQQNFPSKPIRLVASTTAGGQPDTIARMIAQKMSEHWGRPVIVDNRPGGGGTLAAATVAKAASDGHTLLYVLPNFVISPALQPSLPFDPLKDFAGIGQIGISTNILVVTPALGVKTVKDFIALAKTQPGKLIFGSGATGTAGHLSGARFGLIAGIKVIHVAFKGGPDAAIEVLAGRSHYTVATMGVALPFIKEGKLQPLAVTSPQRAPVLPEVPALAETQPEFSRPETSHGLVAPAGTSRAVLNQISKETARILDLPDIRERLQSISYVIAPSTPEAYDKILRTQIETISRLVRDAGLIPK